VNYHFRKALGGLLNPYVRASWLTLTVEGWFLSPKFFIFFAAFSPNDLSVKQLAGFPN
jgi:uncharacterized membrane protein